jgi:hypothetical protein
VMKFCIWGFFENLARKFKLHENPTGITVTLQENALTLLTISR